MSVTLDGVKETLRAMRRVDPELLKEMNKEAKLGKKMKKE